jgi:TolB-like protein
MFFVLLVAVSAWGYEKEIEQLSATMAEKIADKGKKTVAVVDFTDLEGNVTQLDRFIAEEFSVALAGAGKGFRVIDRTHLKSIIKENKLSATGLIDPATARKLGKIAGVDALVTGTLTPFGDNVRVTVKVLDSDTADIIDAAKSKFAKTQAIDEMLGKEITVMLPIRDNGKKTEASPKIVPPKKGESSGTFFDDFNAGPKPDWKPINGNWTMANGKYIVTSIQNEVPYCTILQGKEWRNLIVKIDIHPGYTTDYNSNGWYRVNICPRMISAGERICFGVVGRKNSFSQAYWFVVKKGENEAQHIAKVPIETSSGQPVNIKIEVKGDIFTAYINDTQVNQIYDKSFTSGSVGLVQWYQVWEGERKRIAFDNIEIKPLAD